MHPRVDELVPGFGQEEPASEAWFYEPNERRFVHARYRGASGSAWLDGWEVNLARQVIVDDRRTRDTGSPVDNREQNESTLDGLTGQLRVLLSDRLDLVLGAEFYRDEVRSARQLVDVENGNVQDVRGRFPDRSTQDSELNVSEGDERVEGFPETPGDRIPPLNGRLGLRWAAATRWEVEAWAIFAAEQDRLSPRDRLDPRIDPNGTPGWLTLNARTRWQLDDALTLGLKLSNLLDEDYREHGSGIDAAGFGVGAWIDVVF